MLRIYQQADIVWADLGDAFPDESHGVAKFINLMIEVLDINNGGFKLKSGPKEVGLPSTDPLWVIWQEFLSRPYFTRLWTVQEFAFAKELWYVYGQSIIPWAVLATITSAMQRAGIGETQRNLHRSGDSMLAINALLGAQGAERLHWSRSRLVSDDNAGRGLPPMLRMSRRCLATDPKDKIFAVLGMARGFDCNQPGMRISYSPTESVAEVYLRVAQCMIKAGFDFTINVLHEAGSVNEERLTGLPSWVPDWSKRRAMETLLNRIDIPGGTFAANNLPMSASLSEDGRRLNIRAAVLDTVVRKTRARTMDNSTQHTDIEIWKEQHRWFRDAILLHMEVDGPGYSTHMQKVEAFCRTVVANMAYDARTEALVTYLEGLRYKLKRVQLIENAFMRLGPGEEFHPDQILGDHPSQDAIDAEQEWIHKSQAFTMAMTRAMAWRSFVVAAKGYYGLAYGSVEIGDLIVLIAGMDAPFVMRACDGIDGGWTLICECYIHGYMKGEACDNVDWLDITLA